MITWLQSQNIPVTLTTLSDAGAFLAHEHQLHLGEVFGQHQWAVDLSVPSFSVAGDHPLTCTAMHVLGTAAPDSASWLWSWANPSFMAPAATGLAAWLRTVGEEHGIVELTTPELSFAQLPGASTEPADAAWALVNAAKAASGRWSAYTGDAGGGTRIAFLIEHPDFQLPPPSGPRMMRVLQEGLAGAARISDHRLAVRGYANARGFEAVWSGNSVVLSAAGVDCTIEFDEWGRISRMTGTLSST